MAKLKLAVLFTVIFLLFTFSQARFFTTIPDQTVTDLPESTTAIRLPTERPDDAAAAKTETESGVGSVPLKKINFYPVNRLYPRRPVVFPFRHRHHSNCRLNKHFRHSNPRAYEKRFFKYGNDVIVSDERSFDPETLAFVREIEAGWGSFSDDGSSAESKQTEDHDGDGDGFLEKFRRLFLHV